MTRKNKFGVAPKSQRTLDGIVFASKGEMKRWAELQLLSKAGKITHLVRQEPYKLTTVDHTIRQERIKIATYIADFSYRENNQWIVEDFSGFINPLKRHKLKHFEAEYGITVLLTSKPMRRAKVRA